MINKISAYIRLKFLNLKSGVLMFAFILIFAKLILAGEINEPAVKDFSVNKKNKTISYVLTKPATVRLRVGSKSGPLYRTLVNWRKQGKGRHSIKWNGMDSSGALNILDNENFTFSFNYYLAGEEKPILREYLDSEIIFSDNFIGRAPRLPHLGQSHKQHKKEYCKDLKVTFKVLPRIGDIRPIMIEIPGKDKFWFREERFSLYIFVDDVFVEGASLGYTPYTWNFNPKGLNKGRHLITVNLKGFNDHMAAGSLPVYVD